MRLLFTAHFNRAYNDAPKPIQEAFDKQSLLMLQNLRHPSLTGGSTFESSATPTS